MKTNEVNQECQTATWEGQSEDSLLISFLAKCCEWWAHIPDVRGQDHHLNVVQFLVVLLSVPIKRAEITAVTPFLFEGLFGENLLYVCFLFLTGRKKLRLFEYLHESLQNPDMANCIQWIDQPNGIFQFVSKNKEKLAELWGERKGNRKTMTYQKMARALRNYGRTGEIIKIRRKLTYQFGSVVLQRLSPTYVLGKDIDPYVQDDQECSYPSDWTCPNRCPKVSHHYW
uniref:Transcription factor Spi-C n=1 Tax=Varanus komodoensis TaxID=61221 RepID=A0A8D2KQW4_VARKO